MRHAIELAATPDHALRNAIVQADKEAAQLAGTDTKVHVDGVMSKEGVPFEYKGVSAQEQKSALSGGFYTVYFDTPIDTSTMLPRQWTALIELLRIHGVETQTLDHDATLSATVTRLLNPQWAQRPFEGRHRVEFRIEHTEEPRTFAEGSIVVPMKQRAARVALNILEPGAPDSAAQWGFMDAIFEQKEDAAPYILEPIAQKMMVQREDLRIAFEKRLREDSTFAADPRARLRWWYDRSPYAEADRGVYPVFRLAAVPVRSLPKTAPQERRSSR
jgi:hypothetical protein